MVKYNYAFDVPNQGHISLDHETAIKDLGVLMDSNLSYSNHIHDKANLTNKMPGIIKRNFIDLDKDCFLLLYKSMVRPGICWFCLVPIQKGSN